MRYLSKLHLHLALKIIMFLCVLGILYCVFLLFLDNHEYNKGNAVYQQLRLYIRESELVVNKKVKSSEAIAEATKENQDMNEREFASLKKINSDVVGWIIAKGTKINYPIVRGKDNDFYLHHLFSGELNKLGSIFMDYRNDRDFNNKNTIIYGHNMKDGSMFSSISKYKDQQYYDDFPTMLLYAPTGIFTIELFAGIIVNGDYESIPFAYKDDSEFKSYIESLKNKSTFKSRTSVKMNDRIVTLCTCSYEYDNARYILFGKLATHAKNITEKE